MSELRILIADDSALQREILQQALSRAPHTVHVASNGQEAIEIFGRVRPDMVITDGMMPDPSGLELCRQMRGALPSYTYIIMLTSNTDKENVVRGLAAGADDYLTKPFRAEELLARVEVGRRWLELQRQLEAKNRLLEELALTDALTGLPNRRAIEDWAEHQLAAAARHGFSFWVALIDLDDFKTVNDKHGHAAGDAVLKRFSEILKEQTRSADISGRIGGEEFLHVVTHADEASVKTVMERMRARFAEEKFVFGDGEVTVTASLGVVGFLGDAAPAFRELLSRADQALYRAKRLGRNRTELDPLRHS